MSFLALAKRLTAQQAPTLELTAVNTMAQPCAWLLYLPALDREIWLVRSVADLDLIAGETDGRVVVFGDELPALRGRSRAELLEIITTKAVMGPGTRVFDRVRSA